MAQDTMAKDTVAKDTMAPARLRVVSSSVDLSKNVGRKVSVTGSSQSMSKDAMTQDSMSQNAMANDPPTFSVKTLKVLASSCS